MAIRALVTVDFGSAFTKVAVRRGWNADASLVRGLPVAARDPSYCIPSVVARVRSAKGERWAIGIDAANQIPNPPEVTVYQNWKAGVFGTRTEDESLSNSEVKTVAEQFFRRLRDSILGQQAKYDLDHLPLRICIPRLRPGDGSEALVRHLLSNAGWDPAKERPWLYEPEANVIGVLSRGRNATWIPPYHDFTPHRGRSALLPQMLDPSLSEAFRRGAMKEKQSYYGVLVTDIGAFTTDFAYIRFDTSFWTDEWTAPQIKAVSCDLGIRQLDQIVFQQLSREAREAIQQASAAAWDACKERLYQGDAAAIPKREGGVLLLGENWEARVIRDAIGTFADQVWQTRQEFCDTQLTDSVHAEIPTGGGFMIPLIRKTLVMRIKETGVKTVHDLLDDAEPRKALRADVPERDLEHRRAQNLELVRGATAMGACSVFFE